MWYRLFYFLSLYQRHDSTFSNQFDRRGCWTFAVRAAVDSSDLTTDYVAGWAQPRAPGQTARAAREALPGGQAARPQGRRHHPDSLAGARAQDQVPEDGGARQVCGEHVSGRDQALWGGWWGEECGQCGGGRGQTHPVSETHAETAGRPHDTEVNLAQRPQEVRIMEWRCGDTGGRWQWDAGGHWGHQEWGQQ